MARRCIMSSNEEGTDLPIFLQTGLRDCGSTLRRGCQLLRPEGGEPAFTSGWPRSSSSV